MIIAVFADIHGNVYSLEKALTVMETFKPDQYLFLGDMAAYYYYQNESIELLKGLDNLISLKGNHDENFLDCLINKNQLKAYDDKYGKSYSLLYKNITQQSVEFFNSLIECVKNEHYEAYHASPNDYLREYVYKDTEFTVTTDAPLIFLGHTHHPMNRKVNDTTVINPGSIGQPRDYNNGSFAIVDLKDQRVENVRYKYDKSQLEKRIIELNDNRYLLDILRRRRQRQ